MEEYTLLDKLSNENMLVAQAKTDNQAFTVLYDFYFPRIYSFVYKRTGSREVTEDIVSTTFIKVFTGLKKFQAKNENSLAAWMYRIAGNKLIDYYRGQGRRPTVNIDSITEPTDNNQNPHVELISQLDREVVQKVLASLSVRDQQILHLKFFADLDNIEIAQTLEIKANNVGVWLFRALKRFQAIYQKYE